jgi:hypothetical protein
MFIAVRVNITDDQESRVCLMNTGKNSLDSVPARASDSSDIVVPGKGQLLEAGHACLRPGEALFAVG